MELHELHVGELGTRPGGAIPSPMAPGGLVD
jgi:hypothetical protein